MHRDGPADIRFLMFWRIEWVDTIPRFAQVAHAAEQLTRFRYDPPAVAAVAQVVARTVLCAVAAYVP
jgi:hypothetical protein